ncbi:MAG: YdiU family protein [Gammaproteobacteria bacterium]|nr:YdiU family protein [Gammaproteobacteria bacterium]
MSDVLSYIESLLSPSITAALPGAGHSSHQPQQTPGKLWHRCDPTPVVAPQLAIYSQALAQELGLPPGFADDQAFIAWLAGNRSLESSPAFANCYGGHQFGHWAGQLGDGRALTIAELCHAQHRYEWQLKGAGPTPYSRQGDGRAVLRSSIREFLCSEAMHHLGIPTTRALSLVSTGEAVVRDVMYDGNAAAEPGAIVCRVAPSFIRFGHFELLAARQEHDLLKQFLHFVMDREFAALELGHNEQGYAEFFAAVCQRTAQMIVHWQRVGFVHGVMNTDNMSILGLTIDYGPYGWLDNYDPDFTPNTTDAQKRRYRFSQQPAIARWNLICLANALAAIIDDHDIFRDGIALYDTQLSRGLAQMYHDKLGLPPDSNTADSPAPIVTSLLQLMTQFEIDHTLFFAALSAPEATLQNLYPALYDSNAKAALAAWFADYQQLSQGAVDHRRMQQTNPAFILRNYLTQQAIEQAEQGNFAGVFELMSALQEPYASPEKFAHLRQKRPEWARHKVGCSMLSCSS